MGKTLKDIATELDISPTTVSLIINNRPCRVSDQTRKAVLDLVKKYNYTPNSSARALVTKKTQTIGLIVPDISNPFFAALAKGVEREAQKQNYSVIFCNSDDNAAKDIKNSCLLISKQVDGLILAPSLNEKNLEAVKQFNQLIYKNPLPVVFVDRTIPGCDFNSVMVDHRKGGLIAANHLLHLGHKRIGCITGPLDLESANGRFMGYLSALRMANIIPDDRLYYNGNYQIESGITGAKKLIDNGATAIFASNDLMAMGTMRQARKMGLTPGKDIAIIGFDDIPVCEVLDQPLTTINQMVYQMGKHSFKLVVQSIEQPRDIRQSIMLLPVLVERNTTFKI